MIVFLLHNYQACCSNSGNSLMLSVQTYPLSLLNWELLCLHSFPTSEMKQVDANLLSQVFGNHWWHESLLFQQHIGPQANCNSRVCQPPLLCGAGLRWVLCLFPFKLQLPRHSCRALGDKEGEASCFLSYQLCIVSPRSWGRGGDGGWEEFACIVPRLI